MSQDAILREFLFLSNGMALLAATVIGLLSWLLEILFRRRIGVYFGGVAALLVAFLVAYALYSNYRKCGVEPLPEVTDGVLTVIRCEASGFMRALYLTWAFVTVPLLILSSLLLRDWSTTRRHRLA